jgi:hypothetical protein
LLHGDRDESQRDADEQIHDYGTENRLSCDLVRREDLFQDEDGRGNDEQQPEEGQDLSEDWMRGEKNADD